MDVIAVVTLLHVMLLLLLIVAAAAVTWIAQAELQIFAYVCRRLVILFWKIAVFLPFRSFGRISFLFRLFSYCTNICMCFFSLAFSRRVHDWSTYWARIKCNTWPHYQQESPLPQYSLLNNILHTHCCATTEQKREI